jgi:beta-galactosidase
VAYSGHEKVELFLNGMSLGKKTLMPEDYHVAWWKVPYQSGELKVVGYEGDSIKETQILQTAQNPAQLKLTADHPEIQADGQDLSFITVELPDENGFRNPTAENLVNFEISGPGKIVAVASSNPMSTESFQQPQRKAYKGRCLVIVKSEKMAGKIVLKAKSEGLPDSELVIVSK